MPSPLSAPEVALLTLLVGGISAFLGWLARGASFVSKRWITGAARQEKASFYQAVTDIAAKMKASGARPEEIAEIAKLVTSEMRTGGTTAVEIITGEHGAKVDDRSEHPAFWSNPAMKMRAGAKAAIATAQLEAALTDLRLLMTEHEQEYLEKAQSAWENFHQAQIDLAFTEYFGGTHASLAAELAGIAETEHRLAQILSEVADRKSR
jgi:uncharacterized protein YecT (DUF1311 family)